MKKLLMTLTFLLSISLISCKNKQENIYKLGTYTSGGINNSLEEYRINDSNKNETISLKHKFNSIDKLLDIEINYYKKDSLSDGNHYIVFDNTINESDYRNYINEESLILKDNLAFVPAIFTLSYENKDNEKITQNINRYLYSNAPLFIFNTTNNAKNINVEIKFQVYSSKITHDLTATFYPNKESLSMYYDPYKLINTENYLYGHINSSNNFKLSKEIHNNSINYNYKVTKVDEYYLNEHEINLECNKLDKDTTYTFVILNAEEHLKERFLTSKDGNIYLNSTIIEYEYYSKDQLVKETIDNYKLNGHYDLKIDLSFPKNAKKLKINIKTNLKKDKKIVSYYEGIFYEIK